MEKIGLIAGNRKFPLIFAEAAKKNNFHIVAIAVKGDTSVRLKKLVDKIHWIGLGEFSRVFEIFKQEEIKKVVMAGQINPRRLFSKDIDKSEEIKELFKSIQDKKADTIFTAVAEKLKEANLELLDSTTFLKELLPKKGTLTTCEPDFLVWEDIYFGLELAKAIAYLDIGQTVAIKQKAVVAVEALEGTDSVIRRAGRIARGGITIIKVSKPRQDVRFDIPVVGLNTVKNLVKAKARCLAIEAEKTLFIDKEGAVKLADKFNIAIVAV
jgi:hypothetical protein